MTLLTAVYSSLLYFAFTLLFFLVWNMIILIFYFAVFSIYTIHFINIKETKWGSWFVQAQGNQTLAHSFWLLFIEILEFIHILCWSSSNYTVSVFFFFYLLWSSSFISFIISGCCIDPGEHFYIHSRHGRSSTALPKVVYWRHWFKRAQNS